MILSLNPLYPGQEFLWVNHWIDADVVEKLKQARAIIVPQVIDAMLYHFIKSHCPNVFPNYDTRFKWTGKVGDALLAWSLGIPHPRTAVFPKVVSLVGDHEEMGKGPFPIPTMPFVIKSNSGGEGSGTWLIRSKQDLEQVLGILKHEELQGRTGFVVQQYVPGLERTLRVVVIGKFMECYWRVAEDGEFHSNVARGARIERDTFPEMMEQGRKLVRMIVEKTMIDLAGFDICFLDDRPHLLEINYTFGRTGLGGQARFARLFTQAVEAWLKGL